VTRAGPPRPIASRTPSSPSRCGCGAGAATFAIVTLGCPKNEADSQRLEALLGAAGHRPAAPSRAELIIVNTCGFIDAAKEESIDVLLDACGSARRRGAAVAAVGCLVQRHRTELVAELPEIDVWAGFEVEPLVAALAAIARGGRRGAEEGAADGAARTPRRLRPLHAYLKISDGCDRTCAFCAIPLIKGGYQAVPSREILELAGAALSRGARELVLVGQDTSGWHEPGYGGLARLLADLARLEPLWLRLLYLQPEGITSELLEAVAAHAVPYLDVPFQHSSARVLRAMGRTGDGDAFLAMLERARRVLPDVTVRSTFIAGFPGETDDEFEELMGFVAAARLAVAGVFPFDAQDGTRAAAFRQQVALPLREERAARLAGAVEEAARVYWESFVGASLPVLVTHGCRGRGGEAVGRIDRQAPDVDGITVLAGSPLRRGAVVRATVTGVAGYDLLAACHDVPH
jgi:ribosomal protein S12 methylthiotransferase